MKKNLLKWILFYLQLIYFLAGSGPISNEWNCSKCWSIHQYYWNETFSIWFGTDYKILFKDEWKVKLSLIFLIRCDWQMKKKMPRLFSFPGSREVILEFQNESYFIWYWDNFHRRNSTQFQINIPVELTWADQVSGHAIIRLTNVPNNLQMNLLYDFWRMGLKSTSQKTYLS